jgi:class 3 adenylate cyclase
MFCDLVGSAALSDQLEVEDMRSVLGAYQGTCKAVIDRHAGTIARYVGDGLLVFFGYPESSEAAPQDAARAALAIVASIGALQLSVGGRRVALRVRIGIETGAVLIGHIDRAASLERDAAVGSVPNVAARLQALAAPNGILVGDVAHRHLRDGFECRAAGEVLLKGIARPLTVHEVLAESGTGSSSRRGGRELSPLVERDPQLEHLRAAWQQVKRSQPAVVCISGEAGVGKSRLVRALVEELLGEGVQQIVYRCAPQHQGSPLYPAAVQLRHAFTGAATRRSHQRDASTEWAQQLGLPSSVIEALASLAGLPPEASATVSTTPPADLRRETLYRGVPGLAVRSRIARPLASGDHASSASRAVLGRLFGAAVRPPGAPQPECEP